MSLRQVRAVVAVVEVGSFTKAAEREHATQSGISQHVGSLERALGVKLFERHAGGITPTPAGEAYYRRAIEAVALLEVARREAVAVNGRVNGTLKVGLMPTFTRAALAPVLEDFIRLYPDVRLQVIEGYSADLTERVLDGSLDFSIVPHFEGRTGLRARVMARDREMLVSGRRRGLTPRVPVRLAELRPLQLVLPSRGNTRRRNLDGYMAANGIVVDAVVEMDAMIGTLEFVAASDWVTILPALICRHDAHGTTLAVNPLDGPPLTVEFVLIEPARRSLSLPARLFIGRLEQEVGQIRAEWEALLNEV